MKDWLKNWRNPFWYLNAIWKAFSSFISGIFRAFGFNVGGGRPQHENIQPEDVNRAYNDASLAQELPPTLDSEIDTRVQEFLRYVNSTPEERAEFDLKVFDPQQQDFILGLTDEDIEELRRRGPVGQIQAALIGRIPADLEMKAAAVAKPEPSKAELVRQRYLGRIRRSTEDAADGMDFSPLAIR